MCGCVWVCVFIQVRRHWYNRHSQDCLWPVRTSLRERNRKRIIPWQPVYPGWHTLTPDHLPTLCDQTQLANVHLPTTENENTTDNIHTCIVLPLDQAANNRKLGGRLATRQNPSLACPSSLIQLHTSLSLAEHQPSVLQVLNSFLSLLTPLNERTSIMVPLVMTPSCVYIGDWGFFLTPMRGRQKVAFSWEERRDKHSLLMFLCINLVYYQPQGVSHEPSWTVAPEVKDQIVHWFHSTRAVAALVAISLYHWNSLLCQISTIYTYHRSDESFIFGWFSCEALTHICNLRDHSLPTLF